MNTFKNNVIFYNSKKQQTDRKLSSTVYKLQYDAAKLMHTPFLFVALIPEFQQRQQQQQQQQ